MNKSESIFLYEIMERIVRFDIHLDEIKEQFYCDNPNKIALINDYKNCLKALFDEAIFKHDNSNDILKNLKEINGCVNELHNDYLSILPRPSVPVELTRFERVIKKQIVTLNGKQINVSIATNESIGENTEKDYLALFKNKLSLKGIELPKLDNDVDENLISITIPRIDAPNAFRWPSLIHEMCHYLVEDVFGKNKKIKTSFLGFIGPNEKENKIFNSFFKTSKKKRNNPKLESWLQECFCDLFACILIGPSFYFSQFVVFLNNPDQQAIEIHPPHQFRLALIESIINRRFRNLYDHILSKHINDCCDLIENVQKENKYTFDSIPELSEIYNSFNQFFLDFFLCNDTIKENTDINSRLKSLVRRYVMIQNDIVESLIDILKQGFPIPSIRTVDKRGRYMEIPSYVQEILLSSWLVKLFDDSENKENTGLIDKVINQKIGSSRRRTREEINGLYGDIKKVIVRHDQAVLKSIQVSEWFDMLTDEHLREDKVVLYKTKQKTKDKDESKNVLVDEEIQNLVCCNELKIIPLMYSGQIINGKERNQIGTTSIDVRLGTSFQVFSPHQSGIIDFITQEGESFFKESSKRIDLDFLGYITIAPGQFMLGHSMEYIKLPNNICGSLEGRSSFARLGLEIHMTAGFIDPGFEGVITFEIYNAGPTTIRLYPGMRIGQLRFEKNIEPVNTYSKKDVKYKGLLEHNLSLQSKDVEVELIRKYNKQ